MYNMKKQGVQLSGIPRICTSGSRDFKQAHNPSRPGVSGSGDTVSGLEILAESGAFGKRKVRT